jgi:hypothetical protein
MTQDIDNTKSACLDNISEVFILLVTGKIPLEVTQEFWHGSG